MASFHHKPIKKFTLEGQIHDDSVIARLKIEYIKLLITEMKMAGYAPRIDIDPDFTISFNKRSEYFEFKLSVHGVYVGKKKSEWILGIDGTTPIYTQKNKLNEYSQEQV
jgi:hypothetical protein